MRKLIGHFNVISALVAVFLLGGEGSWAIDGQFFRCKAQLEGSHKGELMATGKTPYLALRDLLLEFNPQPTLYASWLSSVECHSCQNNLHAFAGGLVQIPSCSQAWTVDFKELPGIYFCRALSVSKEPTYSETTTIDAVSGGRLAPTALGAVELFRSVIFDKEVQYVKCERCQHLGGRRSCSREMRYDLSEYPWTVYLGLRD
jgi:hypothetical protein